MDEIRSRIIAHSAPMQGQSRVAERGSGYARYANVDGHGPHMQAVLRDAVSMRPEPFIAPRGSIAAYHVDFGVGASQRGGQVVEKVEDARIVFRHGASAVIAQEVVESRNRARIVTIAMAIDDVQPLAGMEVEEFEVVGGRRRIDISCKSRGGNQKGTENQESKETSQF